MITICRRAPGSDRKSHSMITGPSEPNTRARIIVTLRVSVERAMNESLAAALSRIRHRSRTAGQRSPK